MAFRKVTEVESESETQVSRRHYLAATATSAALLAAGSLSRIAGADEGKNEPDTLYGHGMVWNRNLPGVAGELRLAFDLRLDLLAGTGQGTAEDPVHPDWNVHFSITTLEKVKQAKGEDRFTMSGVVTRAYDSANIDVGEPVKIIAERAGDTTAVAIKLGANAFGGAGLIATALLLPARVK